MISTNRPAYARTCGRAYVRTYYTHAWRVCYVRTAFLLQFHDGGPPPWPSAPGDQPGRTSAFTYVRTHTYAHTCVRTSVCFNRYVHTLASVAGICSAVWSGASIADRKKKRRGRTYARPWARVSASLIPPRTVRAHVRTYVRSRFCSNTHGRTYVRTYVRSSFFVFTYVRT